ncbi:MAG: 30S ribosomal protein S18 [Firmicutes bacterium]|nr:30S ribosomal protein S18 [Bacillota bacterium]
MEKVYNNKKKKKVCRLCTEKITKIDYKDVNLLKKHITERGKIISRRTTGLCARHQRKITHLIKRARHLALLPFSVN